MRDIVAWVKIKRLHDAFNSWKTAWTSTRASKLDKVDAIANDTHSVWNSIPSGTDSVAKQSTLNTVNSTLNSVNNNMAKQSTLLDLESSSFDAQKCAGETFRSLADANISIQGSGHIYAIKASFDNSVVGSVTIKIDGKAVITCNPTLDGSAVYYSIRDLIVFEGANLSIPSFQDTGSHKKATTSFDAILPLGENCAFNSYGPKKVLYITNNPLKFNTSLEINITNKEKCYSSIIYSLSE